ncbi:hypothetical protein ACFRFJ_42050 [Streptomyces hydrogenans]|uniref:hypothetical protein n=1 Tax=Streptomyces hydrogenans TaxID=1873719 RepID=UPI0036AF7EB5
MAGGREPDEHARFARYRRDFDEATEEDAPALVARVLADPDRAMASSAVRAYLDRRAAALLTTPGCPSWCAELTGPVAADAFSARRLSEWTLLRAMTLGEPWDPATLLAAHGPAPAPHGRDLPVRPGPDRPGRRRPHPPDPCRRGFPPADRRRLTTDRGRP